MLNASLLQINRLTPSFVVLSGDMQNWWARNEGTQNGALASGYGDVGAMQTASVKNALSLLHPSIPLRAVMPGNHDVGDVPTRGTLDEYQRRWSEWGERAFTVHGVRFLVLNSQLYFDSSQAGVAEVAAEQTAWLQAELDAPAAAEAAGIVMLTHIPPFLGSATESAGWANWPSDVRTRVLTLTQDRARRKSPRLALCGHFHGNVESRTDSFGHPLDVVVTSSVGCPMLWNGSTSYTPSQASLIASEPSGSLAFTNWIMRPINAAGAVNASLIAVRVVRRRHVRRQQAMRVLHELHDFA